MPGDSPKPHKYNARKKEVDGILFDSTREAKRYLELKVLHQAGAIVEFELQPVFLLQEKFRDVSGKLHRKMTYTADFAYRFTGDPRVYVEDCKGYQTQVFRLRWKLVCKKYPQFRFWIVK